MAGVFTQLANNVIEAKAKKKTNNKAKQTKQNKTNQKKTIDIVAHGFDLCCMTDLFSIQSHDFVLTVNKLSIKLEVM